MKSVYLAGPIRGLSYGSATDWREFAKVELAKYDIVGVSPMRAKEFLGRVSEIDANVNILEGLDEVIAGQKGLTTRDRFDATRCDVFLANLLGANKVSIGTMIEYGWADACRKPIITIIEKEGNPHEHAMIRELTGFRVESLEEGLYVAKAILSY